MIFVDTSAFLALVNEKDRHHIDSSRFLEELKNGKTKIRKIFTSDYIIDETITRIRYEVGHQEAVLWGRNVQASKVIEKIEIDRETFEFAWKLFETYDDKVLSFTDCTSFAIMKKRGIEKAFSFDQDFERIGFKLLP